MRSARFRQVRRMAKAAQERRGSGSQRFILNDGETALIWFSGDRDHEPVIVSRHFQVRNQKFFFCSGDDCLACREVDSGNGGINKATSVKVFNVIDTRWFHKIQSSKGGKASYEECTDDSRCRHCRSRVERRRNGRRYWELATKFSDMLGSHEAKLRYKCASCYTGTIRVMGYSCPKCGSPLEWEEPDDYAEETSYIIRCEHCRERITPIEEIECTKCNNPKQATFFDLGCPVEVTRVGAGTSTVYNFQIVWPPPPPEDWILEADQEPLDLYEVTKPLSPQAMAELLNIRNTQSRQESQRFDEYDSHDPFEQRDRSDMGNRHGGRAGGSLGSTGRPRSTTRGGLSGAGLRRGGGLLGRR